MIYKCTQDFEIPWVDEDCYPTEDVEVVVCDSLWELDDIENYTLTGAEARLISLDDKVIFSWIEIGKDILKSNFKIEEE